MRKSTLLLVLPLCLLHAETTQPTKTDPDTKTEVSTKEELTTANWNRDDVAREVDKRAQAREDKEAILDKNTQKLLRAREDGYLKDETEDTIVVQKENMTIEVKEKPKKSDAPVEPTITIEVNEKKSEETPSMIIEVKDESEVPTPKVTMELVKIETIESIPEQLVYPKKFIKIEEEVE